MDAEHDPLVIEIIRLLRQKPFVPFWLVTRDGVRFLIADARRGAARDNRVLFTDPQKGVCFYRTSELATVEPAIGVA